MLEPTRLTPRKGLVLAEAIPEPDTISGLYFPRPFEERFPQLARVVRVGKGVREVGEGDWIVVPNEGFSHERTFYLVLRLNLDGFGTLDVDFETEPVIRDVFDKYRRTSEDSRITIKSIEGEEYQFLASDILEYSLVDIENPAKKVDLVNVSMLHFRRFGEPDTLFYLIEEENILCTIEL